MLRECSLVVEHLVSMCNTLSSAPSTKTKKQTKQKSKTTIKTRHAETIALEGKRVKLDPYFTHT
jgi:hypothetical protein